MILVSNESKISSESHYELFDIMDYLFLNNTLINVCHIANTDLLSIDKVKYIFIFEHIESLNRIATIPDGYTEFDGIAPYLSATLSFICCWR